MIAPVTRRVATICARGGSKGVPRKNLLELDGESLVARAVRQAIEAEIFDLVIVSSDDADILASGRAAGAHQTVSRPSRLASDEAGKVEAIRHAVQTVEGTQGAEFDTIVDLDVTTPLRLPEDIVAVVDQLESSAASIVLTACEARRSPYFNLVELDEEGAPRLPSGGGVVRRQDGPPVYDLSGAVYAWERAALQSDSILTQHTRLHLLPRDRAWDIDEPLDVEIISGFLAARSAGTP